jgi:hypothetical protein
VKRFLSIFKLSDVQAMPVVMMTILSYHVWLKSPDCPFYLGLTLTLLWPCMAFAANAFDVYGRGRRP